jgi:hypothetical protein
MTLRLNFQIVHQVIVVGAQLILVDLLAKIVFYIILIALKGAENIRNL